MSEAHSGLDEEIDCILEERCCGLFGNVATHLDCNFRKMLFEETPEKN